jgi:predicted alpha/beta hydrolase family esterase
MPDELSGTRFLLLDGWQHRRQPVHWQGWLAERLVERGAEVDYLTLPDPENPRYADWSAVVLRALAGGARTAVVAHGLSVLLWLRMCGDAGERAPLAQRAVLVAPPETGLHGGDVSAPLGPEVSAETVARATAEPGLLLYSVGDPYLPAGGRERYGDPLGLESREIPQGGHLNQASGLGPWPEMLEWCESGRWPERERHAVERAFAPEGHRLGIVVAGRVGVRGSRAVDAALRGQGLEPARRRAELQPRVGEGALRPRDVAEFAELYGHEYSVALLDRALEGDREQLEGAFSGAGCRVVWDEVQGI